jgi:ATP-dependent Zn protease
VDLGQLARNTHGLTGADLANILNQAALRAASISAPAVGQTDIM